MWFIKFTNISIILNHSNTNLQVSDYKKILLEETQENDFIYLDPPYHPINVTSNFPSYTNNGFINKDQEEMAKIFKKLTDRGCQILLSNSDSKYIRELYSEFKDNIIEVKTILLYSEFKENIIEVKTILLYKYKKQKLQLL